MGRILALGILGALASAQVALAQSGSITGTITTAVTGQAPVRVTIDQKVCGSKLPDEAIVVDARGRLANAVVTVAGLKRAGGRESMVMNEKCRFAPRVQVARPNGSVRTSSKDPVLHTTQAQYEDGRTIFNVGLPVPGITITKAVGRAATVRLHCNTHPWMRGWLVVTDEAAAVSGADGRFTIDNVPPGTYQLRIWHEALKSASQTITVVAGQHTDVKFELR